MSIILKDFIRSYQNNRRHDFTNFLAEIKQSGLTRKSVFPHISNSSFEILKQKEYLLDPLLRDCQTDIEVMNVLSDVLGGIPGIGEKTIIDFAEYYCYKHDIHIDDDCETLFSKKGKEVLEENNLTVNSIRDEIQNAGIPHFSNYEIIDFVNNYCTKKSTNN